MTRIEITTPITLKYVKSKTKEELYDLIIMLCDQADRVEKARLAAIEAFSEKVKKHKKIDYFSPQDKEVIDQLVEEERRNNG